MRKGKSKQKEGVLMKNYVIQLIFFSTMLGFSINNFSWIISLMLFVIDMYFIYKQIQLNKNKE